MAGYLVLGAESSTLGDFLFYLVSFIVLVILIKHFAWGPVMNMMEARTAKITGDLEYADSERDRAEKLAKEREDALKNSRSEALEIVANAKQNGEAQKSSIIEDANKNAEMLRRKAIEDAEQAKKDALKDAQDDITNISVSIASKLLQRELSATDQKNLVDSYIKELNADETN